MRPASSAEFEVQAPGHRFRHGRATADRIGGVDLDEFLVDRAQLLLRGRERAALRKSVSRERCCEGD